MAKNFLDKIKDVLFEKDDEYEDEDEEYEEEEEVKTSKKKAQPVESATLTQEEKTQPSVINRVELTQAVPTVKEPPAFTKSSSNQSSFSSYKQEETNTAPAPLQETTSNSGFNLIADEPEIPAVPSKNEKKKKNGKSSSNAYEFRPVISPMFGVDEKDMDAMQTGGHFRTDEQEGVSKIISPMYGMTEDAKPIAIQNSVEKSNEFENTLYNQKAKMTESAIPEFSLDDILNARDSEVNSHSSISPSANAESDGYVDETVVIDSRNLFNFDDETTDK